MTARAEMQELSTAGSVTPLNGAALVTASYSTDFERCRLLCESVDRFVTGFQTHYLLVAGFDTAQFRKLESRNRVVIDERDLLPSWLHSLRDPTSLFRRHIWLSTRTPPLRGWHVQQLRRIALASKVPEAALLYCDSDVFFLKPFDLSCLWRDGALRFYRQDGGLPIEDGAGHVDWHANAGFTLGLPEKATELHDYISNLVHWRRDTVLAMVQHIENVHGRHWVEAVTARRHFSECILYGRYVDEVLSGDGHFHADVPLALTYWWGPSLDEEGLRRLIGSMRPEQVAVGVQSFTGTDLDMLRRLIT